MSRWLVTGANGMLGRDMVSVLESRVDLRVTPASRGDLDITDRDAVRAWVAGHDVVVNTAAWTDVDAAETHEAAATAVNGTGVANLAAACADTGARLLHVSTDYVFAGDATRPYPEDAPTGPTNAYGRSKVVGERAVARLLPGTGYVVRTAWLYGVHGRNFVTTMLRLSAHGDELFVVDDQHGQPTWSRTLAERLVDLGRAAYAGRAPAGVYHGTASGHTTRYGLAREIFTLNGLDPDRIRPTSTDRTPRPARRPAYSVLAHGRWAAAGLSPLPEWRVTLAQSLPDLGAGQPVVISPGTGQRVVIAPETAGG